MHLDQLSTGTTMNEFQSFKPNGGSSRLEGGDLDPLARMMADPEVARFIGGVQPRSNVWRSHGDVRRPLGLARIRLLGRRAQIGRRVPRRVGLWQPEDWPDMELAWTLDRPHWGNGYATEAAEAALDHGFLNHPVPRLVYAS